LTKPLVVGPRYASIAIALWTFFTLQEDACETALQRLLFSWYTFHMNSGLVSTSQGMFLG
jgi:hypothetical protein